MTCALCRNDEALDRMSGVDLCSTCRSRDPTDALAALGIEAEWDTRLRWFSAGLGIPGQDPDFTLKCTPELLLHKAAKLLVHEVEVGDPVFDSRVFVRTSDPARAADILGREGVQSALLVFLTGVRTNELLGNHVTLKGATLTVRSRPESGLSDERILALQLETTALALQLRAMTSLGS